MPLSPVIASPPNGGSVVFSGDLGGDYRDVREGEERAKREEDSARRGLAT